MINKFTFEPDILHCVAGGRSAIEIQKLNITNLSEGDSFLASYGFDIKKQQDVERLWHFHRRALVIIVEKLGIPEMTIPEILKDRKKLEDVRKLLLFASSSEAQQANLQKWSCALLRAMHVFVHAESDLFSFFSEEIQQQILSPFQKSIYLDGKSHLTFLKGTNPDHSLVEINKFETKPFKTSSSTVIKLLAKPDALAMRVFDKLGVRFVTHSVFDSFQVIRFLVRENIISFPHIMPDQSSNNIYPTELFLQIVQDLEKNHPEISDIKLKELFEERLENEIHSAKFLRKENLYSAQDYRFIKFITRKLIHITPEGRDVPFSFFFPYEVQIIDRESHEKTFSGPSDHDSYKERQREAARKRLFPGDYP